MILRRSLAGIVRSVAGHNATVDPVLFLPGAIVGSSYATWKTAGATHSEGKKQPSSGRPEGTASVARPSPQKSFPANHKRFDHYDSLGNESEENMPPGVSGARDKGQVGKRECPRPEEIPLQPSLANTVDLVGRVGLHVHVETLPDGTACAVTVLERKGDGDFPKLWIPVIFEGHLASIAACHLKENDLIHVCGKLSADSPQILIENRESTVKVMAQSLEFVVTTPQEQKAQPMIEKPNAAQLSGKKEGLDPNQDLWVDFIENPGHWLDNRKNKTKAKQPDFTCKSSGKALWVSKRTPAPALLALESPTFCKKLQKITERSTVTGKGVLEVAERSTVTGKGALEVAERSTVTGKGALDVAERSTVTGKGAWSSRDEDSWKDLIANPDKWRDTRLNKRNPKFPDFKHKETGKSLWLNSCPDWVRSHYPPAQ